MRQHGTLVWCIISLILAACGGNLPDPTLNAAAAVSTETATPTPRPSATFTPSPTFTPTATLTPYPAILSESDAGLEIVVDRVREAENIGERKPNTPAETYLIVDTTVTNRASNRKCLHDIDLKAFYPRSINENAINTPNLDRIVDDLKKADPTYENWDFVKPNHVWVTARGFSFCIEPNSTKPTVLVYAAPEGWAQMTLQLGESSGNTASMCLARTNTVKGGFREIYFTTRCSFRITFEQSSEAYLTDGFFSAVEETVQNCDSDNTTVIAKGAQVPQPPSVDVQLVTAPRDFFDFMESLLPDRFVVNVSFVRIELVREVATHHVVDVGKPLVLTTSLEKIVPGRSEAKYRFTWREIVVKGMMKVEAVSDDGHVIFESYVPYNIHGQIQQTVETVYERPCGAATP